MSKGEQLFNEFRELESKLHELTSIVQNEESVTWEDIETFDRNLSMLTRELQSMRMKVILHLKDSGKIKQQN